jgi:hypothetical protein
MGDCAVSGRVVMPSESVIRQLIGDDGVPDDFREFGRVQMSEDLETAARFAEAMTELKHSRI